MHREKTDKIRITIHCGDAREMLPSFPEGVFQCAVTSPPYWRLRLYPSLPDSVWDGDAHCQHDWVEEGQHASRCRSCGAWKGQLGQEPDPDEYAAHLAEVCRPLRRVLRADGTLWMVLGDTYVQRRTGNLPPKSLADIPSRVARALQEDGWIPRSRIIWAKTNPTPSSVKDRPVSTYEVILLLSKSSKYYFDWAGSKEETEDGGVHMMRDVWLIPTSHRPRLPGLPTHFATFPLEIPLKALAAGASLGGACPVCGAPRLRKVRVHRPVRGCWHDNRANEVIGQRCVGLQRKEYRIEFLGWEWSCKCHRHGVSRCLVLDPFAGAGTTLLAAAKLGFDAVGIDADPLAVALARRRLQAEVGLIADIRVSNHHGQEGVERGGRP